MGGHRSSSTTTFDTAQLEALTGAVSGSVLLPEHDGYEDARRIHNGLIDRRPAVIVRCRSADDVAAGVRFARAAGLDICVRGGGHNVAGRAVVEDAVMIDLAEMKGTDVDPESGTVRAEGGLTWARAQRRRRPSTASPSPVARSRPRASPG